MSSPSPGFPLLRFFPDLGEPESSLVRGYEEGIDLGFARTIGAALLRHFPERASGQCLNIECRLGYPATALLAKMEATGRVIATDSSSAFLEVARARAGAEIGKRIFFKLEPVDRLAFGDGVFDHAVALMALETASSEAVVLSQLHRVLAPNGKLYASRLVGGSFLEIIDMLRETSLRVDAHDVLREVEAFDERLGKRASVEEACIAAGFEIEEIEEHELKVSARTVALLWNHVLLSNALLPALYLDKRDASALANDSIRAVWEGSQKAHSTYLNGDDPVEFSLSFVTFTAKKK